MEKPRIDNKENKTVSIGFVLSAIIPAVVYFLGVLLTKFNGTSCGSMPGGPGAEVPSVCVDKRIVPIDPDSLFAYVLPVVIVVVVAVVLRFALKLRRIAPFVLGVTISLVVYAVTCVLLYSKTVDVVLL